MPASVEKNSPAKVDAVVKTGGVPVVANEQLSAFTTTDVKDLGDLIIVTTTTTTVYRKGV